MFTCYPAIVKPQNPSVGMQMTGDWPVPEHMSVMRLHTRCKLLKSFKVGTTGSSMCSVCHLHGLLNRPSVRPSVHG